MMIEPIAIHVTSEEEFDKVIKYGRSIGIYSMSITKYIPTYIRISKGSPFGKNFGEYGHSPNVEIYSKFGRCPCKILTFNEFKQQYLMKKKAIEMTLEQAQKFYKDGNEDMKNFLLTTFIKEELEDNKYPNTWEECVIEFKTLYFIGETTADIISCNLPKTFNTEILKNCLPSEKIAKQVRALEMLLICRDVWRNGWIPRNYNYYIYKTTNSKLQVSCSTISRVLSFKTNEIAENFLNTFRDLIEEAGDLI